MPYSDNLSNNLCFFQTQGEHEDNSQQSDQEDSVWHRDGHISISQRALICDCSQSNRTHQNRLFLWSQLNIIMMIHFSLCRNKTFILIFPSTQIYKFKYSNILNKPIMWNHFISNVALRISIILSFALFIFFSLTVRLSFTAFMSNCCTNKLTGRNDSFWEINHFDIVESWN